MYDEVGGEETYDGTRDGGKAMEGDQQMKREGVKGERWKVV
jgi:hypothetical protein